jgi:tetratricopeptide (TPR) repeat protein
MHKGEYEYAIQDYSRTLQFNPTDFAAYYNRGLAYAQEGDYDRAIQDYDQALLINPKFGVGFRFRSIAYSHKGAYRRAIADWSRWLWLRHGPLGITIRLSILAVTIGFGFGLTRFRQEANVP